MTGSPIITVGILFSPEIRFRLNGQYRLNGSNRICSGEYIISREGQHDLLQQGDTREYISLPVHFSPTGEKTCTFDLTDVVIGINFHWERKEEQKFTGELQIIDEGQHLTAINILPLEDYLLSVISSEMKASSPAELLKAHAVISRSWLLAQKVKASKIKDGYQSFQQTDEEYVRWYDREDHAHFDVCADDHCQRYQGISRACTTAVQDAMEATCGEVLMFGEQICDARFSKCCGGVTERFENTWEPEHHPYLDKVCDTPDGTDTGDLCKEEEAREWILSSPAAFCNTTDKNILSAVLNSYDQETSHFFRWDINYTTEEISHLVHKRLDLDFGTITDIIPMTRGVSGRIIRLKIIGTKRSMIIGKELVIRKAFSESHLYSSAFIVEKSAGGFRFRGAGWGHGVGLCQIGAAVMASQGYNYREILQHYFSGSEIRRIY